ncbi:MAG: ABC transporter ATP-binding protein [Sporolactobacillus sp.]
MIDFDHVSYRYRSDLPTIIDDLNLHIAAGTCTVLTGQSGCGKTTVTRLVNGLAFHFYPGELSGRLTINGTDPCTQPFWACGRHVGSVLQDPSSQFFASKAVDEIAFGCENYGMPPEQIRSRVAEAALATGSGGLLSCNLFHLSSGQQQRLAIASIYAVNPPIYVFDEPSANLDSEAVEQLRTLITQLKLAGKTVLIAEHRLHYLTGIADRFVYMEGGRICREFRPDELLGLSESSIVQLGLRRPAAVSISRTGREPARLSQPAVLEIDRLSFAYGKHQVLRHVSLKAAAGEIIALTGTNGAGKTTLARLICGLYKEAAGCVRINGRALKCRQRRRKAFFVMQHADSQLFAESVRSEIELSLDDQANGTAVNALLERYRLIKYADSHPSVLSGGQKQRLMLAVAEAQRSAQLVLLDEPTSGLDGASMRLVADCLLALAARRKTVIVISHDMEFIARTCSRMIRLSGGEVNADERLLPAADVEAEAEN